MPQFPILITLRMLSLASRSSLKGTAQRKIKIFYFYAPAQKKIECTNHSVKSLLNGDMFNTKMRCI